MKKILCMAIVLLSIMSLLLCGCSKTQSVYEALNDMVNAAYTDYTIDVETTMDGNTLKSNFAVGIEGEKANISYRYERLNTFTETSGELSAPEEYKTTLEGTVEVVNDKVTQLNGEAVDLAFDRLSAPSIRFDESYFTNAESTPGKFSADVSDVKAFTGSEAEYKSMRVEVEYSEKLNSIAIFYTSENDASVKVVYTFNR